MSTVDPAEPRRGRPRDLRLRTRVLTAVASQLGRSGFGALTMEAILEETGIAKRTLYRWWPNKSALVAEAVLGGFVAVPETRVAHSDDVWADLRDWLESIAGAVRGPYGEVLRAAVAIGASDAALADSMERVFAAPARANITHRLELAIRDRQVTPVADLDTVVDLLMAIIVFAGVSRGEPERLSATLGLIRSGLSI